MKRRTMKFNQTAIVKYLHFFLLITVLMPCIRSNAQAKFFTRVNEKQISQNDYLQVEYTIENAKSVEKFTASSFKNFRIIQGPIQASGMSITNGVMSQYKGMSFILQPLTRGRLEIPGSSAVIDGQPMQSNTVSVDVVPGGGSNSLSLPRARPAWPDPLPQVNEDYNLLPRVQFIGSYYGFAFITNGLVNLGNYKKVLFYFISNIFAG